MTIKVWESAGKGLFGQINEKSENGGGGFKSIFPEIDYPPSKLSISLSLDVNVPKN